MSASLNIIHFLLKRIFFSTYKFVVNHDMKYIIPVRIPLIDRLFTFLPKCWEATTKMSTISRDSLLFVKLTVSPWTFVVSWRLNLCKSLIFFTMICSGRTVGNVFILAGVRVLKFFWCETNSEPFFRILTGVKHIPSFGLWIQQYHLFGFGKTTEWEDVTPVLNSRFQRWQRMLIVVDCPSLQSVQKHWSIRWDPMVLW